MDDQELLKMLAKERYELELMSIELKRLIDLVRWNKEHPHAQNKYNEKVLQIKVEIQNLKMELQRLDLEHLDEKIGRLRMTTPLALSPSS